MSKKLAPVDLRVDTEGRVWHVGNPKAWGKGALDNTDPRKAMKLLQADEIRFIGPDVVRGSGIKFEAHLVALTETERALIAKALTLLAVESFEDDERALMKLAKRIGPKD